LGEISEESMRIIFIIPDMLGLSDYMNQFSLKISIPFTVFKEDGWNVSIFDSNTQDIEKIPASNMYAFWVIPDTYDSCIRLATSIKSQHSTSTIIIGGVYEATHSIFDVAFKGATKGVFQQFIKDWKNGSEADLYSDEKI